MKRYHTTWVLALSALLSVPAFANDWISWRGPEQKGSTRETAVVKSWSQDGDNLLWKVPIGGRTTPVVHRGRVFAIAPFGSAEDKTLGERVVCLDAETGNTLWEYRFNVFHTDIVADRLGWTSVVVDPETSNVYAHGTGGELFCFNREGTVLWKHSLTEEFGRSSGYGGRLHSPIIDENRLIISYVYILSGWDTGKKKAGHRYLAFDTKSGDLLWIGQPGGRPLDTTYSVPVVAVIGGKRMIIGGNADGQVYAMFSRTGEKIWSFRLSDRRGLNTSVVVNGDYVYATHSEENADTTKMGRVVCIDGTKSGDITKTGEVWRADGLQVGYPSPAFANDRLYVATNSANLLCLDGKTGEQQWSYNLGRGMKGSPTVTADGVIYVGEVNGRFHILQDAGDHCESLDEEQFSRPDGINVEIRGSAAVANGRVFFMTTEHLYCLGANEPSQQKIPVPPLPQEAPVDKDNPAMVQIRPPELSIAMPPSTFNLETRLYDANGRYISSPVSTWSVTGSAMVHIDGTGHVLPLHVQRYQSGIITGKPSEFFSADVRVRMIPGLPVNETFNHMATGTQPPGWIGLDVKTQVVDLDGERVLKKLALKPSAKYSRMRAFSAPPIKVGYTVEADMMALPKEGRRPTLSDMGLINARYKLILLGHEKKARIVSYSPIPRIQEEVPFDWQPGVWYRAKLEVFTKGMKGHIRAKIWPRDEEEPTDWLVTVVDEQPNVEGSPGIYAYSKGTTAKRHGSPVFFDNYKVYRNEDD